MHQNRLPHALGTLKVGVYLGLCFPEDGEAAVDLGNNSLLLD
jgi:hypothetical protein